MFKIKSIIIIIFLLISFNLYSQTWTYYTNDWQYGIGQGGGQGNPIITDYYGNLWIGPSLGVPRGLWKYDVDLDQWISFSNIFSNKHINSIYAESEDSYWLCVSMDFIYHFDGNNVIRHYTTAGPYWDFIINKDYIDILVNRNNHVIAVCDRTAANNGILDYYPVDTAPNQTWTHHCYECPNGEDLVNAAMESNGYVLWLSDRIDGVWRVNTTNFAGVRRYGSAWTANIGIDFYNTKYIAILENAGFPNVGCIVRSNNNNTITISKNLTKSFPSHVMIDNDNRKWISTMDGASAFDGTNWTYYSTNNGLAVNEVRAMAQTMDGDYWFFHDNRISRLSLPGREGFQLLSFNNASGDNNGVSDYMTITGTGFRQGAKVKLKRDGQSDIWAAEVQVVDAHTIKCKFNLSGKAIGIWHVVAYNRYRWPHFNYKLIRENIYEVKEAPDEDISGTEECNIKDSYLYPNVVRGEEKISINKICEKTKIKIYDRIGNKLKQAEVTLKDNEIDISDLGLATGIYYVIAEDIATGDTKVLKFLFVK